VPTPRATPLLTVLALPAAVVSVALVASRSLVTIPDPAAAWLTPALAGVGILLGLVFRRGRTVFALLAVLLAERVLSGIGSGAGNELATAAVAILLPIDLTALAMVRERAIVSGVGLVRGTFILGPPAVLALLWATYHPGLTSALTASFLPQRWVPAVGMPHLAVVAFGIGLTVTGARLLARREAQEAAFFWATVAVLAAALSAPPLRTAGFAAAVAVLDIGVVAAAFAMAYRDQLTGIAGRRALDEALGELAGRYTVAVVDVDHFKKVNDRHGHGVGDQVLRMIAGRLAAAAGPGRPFRLGGEEFVLLFPGRGRAEVLPIVDKLRQDVASHPFVLRASERRGECSRGDGRQSLTVTVSVGVAETDEKSTAREVLRAADAALYRAKSAGRNRVAG
jgi:diguanylate cyclase (GGDEF)-like protein